MPKALLISLRLLWVCGCVTAFLPCRMARAQAINRDQQPAWLARRIVIEQRDRSFDLMIRDLSRCTGKTILADGEPVVTKVNEGFSGTTKQVLDTIADRFDFTWSITKRGVVLMNKRFHNPQEVPQVQLPELQRMGKDVMSSFAVLNFDPEIGSAKTLRYQLFESLLPRQKEALLNGVILRAQDLSPDQSELARRAVMNNALSALFNVWNYLNQRLAATSTGTLYMENQKAQPQKASIAASQWNCLCFKYRDFRRTEISPILAREPSRVPK